MALSLFDCCHPGCSGILGGAAFSYRLRDGRHVSVCPLHEPIYREQVDPEWIKSFFAPDKHMPYIDLSKPIKIGPMKAGAGLSIPPLAGFDSQMGRQPSEYVSIQSLTRAAQEKGHEVNAEDVRRFVDRQLAEFFRRPVPPTKEHETMDPKQGRTFLRVKIKSLAAESRIIRAEEQRYVGETRDKLHLHRVLDVRRESRATLWAYAILRGKPPFHGESIRGDWSPCDWQRVAAMVKKYGDEKALAMLAEWQRTDANPARHDKAA